MINIIYKAQALIKQNQARYIAEEWKNETNTNHCAIRKCQGYAFPPHAICNELKQDKK